MIFTKASQMLAEADTIQKAKELKSLALTAAEWAKRKNMGAEAIEYCRSYAYEAEKKMGQLLKEKPPAPKGGDRKSKNKNQRSPKGTVDPKAAPTLAELGIPKKESAEAQMLASLPDDEFEQIKTGKKTRVAAKRALREQKRERRRQENRKKVRVWPAGRRFLRSPSPKAAFSKQASWVPEPKHTATIMILLPGQIGLIGV